VRGKWSRGRKRHTYIRAGNLKETLVSTKKNKNKKKTKTKMAGRRGAHKKKLKRWG
jgi:hypothetical protein